MTTLIAVYNSEGCVGRCDEKCYDAKGDVCECVCGGKNHGKGRQQAIDNIRGGFQEMIDEYKKAKQIPEAEGVINTEVLYQLALF